MSSIYINNKEFSALIIEALQEGKSVRVTAVGWSMWPLINSYKDQLTIAPVEGSLKKGDILLALYGDGILVHRVERIRGNVLLLRGDGNSKQREEVSVESIKGRLLSVRKPNGRIWDSESMPWKLIERFWPSNRYLRAVFVRIHRFFCR